MAGYTTHTLHCKGKNSQKRISLQEITEMLPSIKGNSKEWLVNLRNRALQVSTEKLPRCSWTIIKDYYNRLFEKNISIPEMKNLCTYKKAEKSSTTHNEANKATKIKLFENQKAKANLKLSFLENLKSFSE